eukprot:scaffold141112_cov31-Tisochrysis_lutea.AAC.1
MEFGQLRGALHNGHSATNDAVTKPNGNRSCLTSASIQAAWRSTATTQASITHEFRRTSGPWRHAALMAPIMAQVSHRLLALHASPEYRCGDDAREQGAHAQREWPAREPESEGAVEKVGIPKDVTRGQSEKRAQQRPPARLAPAGVDGPEDANVGHPEGEEAVDVQRLLACA